MSQELKKYLMRSPIGWIMGTVIFGLLLFVFVVCFFQGQDVKPIGLLVFPAGMAACLLPLIFSSKRKKAIDNDPMLPVIETDFAQAVPMGKDSVRFGGNWIFVKKSGRLLTYGEIRQVYQQIQKANFMETERHVMYVGPDGKKHKLCRLECYGASDNDLKWIFALILSKNPNVKLGYK